jgi:mono/diheme cytochrome c family protein
VVRSGASSSTISPAPDRRTLWISSPDDDRLVEVDAASLAVVRSLPTAVEAGAVVRLGDSLLVASARSPSVVVHAVIDNQPSRLLSIPCRGVDAMIPWDDDSVLLACGGDDRVVRLSLAGVVRGVVRVPGRPTALARVDGEVVAGCSRDGTLQRFTWPASLTSGVAVSVALTTRRLADRPGHAASQISAVVPDGAGDVLAVYQDVDRDSDRARPTADGAYGSVTGGDARIEPRLAGLCGSRYARFDGGARVLSGPSALGWDAAHRRVWIAHRYTDNVAVFACDDGPRHLGTFRVGRGPRGIVLSDDGRTAWVDVAFDHAVARLSLDDAVPDRVRDATAVVRRPVEPTRLSADAMRGRSIFHDAVDTHLTPSGVVTCATCHPDGGDDGLVWFLHTGAIAPKLRRTPPAWTARPALAPLHWDGAFPNAGALTRATITGLMGGDGLLVDEVAVGAWLASLPAPTARPRTPEEHSLATAGERVFASAGCADCHRGEYLSDGERHAVLAPSGDPAAQLELVDTPTLRGVGARAPYLHDGRAATLDEVIGAHNAGDRHGRTRGMSDEDRRALISYLEGL